MSAVAMKFPDASSVPRKPAYGATFRPGKADQCPGLTFGAMPSAIRRLPTLSMGAKVMYSAVAEWAATQTEVRPSVSRLALDCGVSAKQARRYLTELESIGFLKVTRRSVAGKPGLNDSNVYELLYQPAFDIPKQRSVGAKVSVLPDLGVLPNLSKRYSQEREASNTIEKDHLREAAIRIHQNHPSARRDIGTGETGKRLAAILKRKRILGADAESYLQGLVDRHARFCSSEQWQKEGGQYAKSLANWLAPTMERYDQDPPPPFAQPRQVETPGLAAEEIL